MEVMMADAATAPVDVSSVMLRSVIPTNDVLDSTITQLRSNNAEVQKVTQDSADIYERDAQMTKDVEFQKAQAEMLAQQNARKLSDTLSANVADLAHEYVTNQKLAEEKRAEITADVQEGDKSGLKYFTNLFVLPFKQMTAQWYQHNAEQALSDINDINSATVTARTAQDKVAAVSNEDTIGKQAQLQADTLQLLSDKAKLSGLVNSAETLKSIASLSEEELNNLHKAVSVKQADAAKELQQENLKLLIEQRQQTLDGQKQALVTYNAGAEKLGKAKLATYGQLELFLKTNPSEAMDTMRYGGSLLMANGDGTASMAPTVGDAAVAAHNTKMLPDGSNNRAVEMVQEAGSAVIAANGNVPLKPDQAAAAINNWFTPKITTLGNDVEAIDFHHNPYYHPGIGVVENLAPQLAAKPEFKAVFDPLQAVGKSVPDAMTVMQSASIALEKNPKSIEGVAQAISQFYSVGSAHNQISGGINQFSLPKISGYPVNLRVSGRTGVMGWSPTIRIDMTDATQVKAYLLRLSLVNKETSLPKLSVK